MPRKYCTQCDSTNLSHDEEYVTCQDCGWFAEKMASIFTNHGMHVTSIPLNDFYAGTKYRIKNSK